jgi:hypothetical protein
MTLGGNEKLNVHLVLTKLDERTMSNERRPGIIRNA